MVENRLEMASIKSYKEEEEIVNISKHLADNKGQITELNKVIFELQRANEGLRQQLTAAVGESGNKEMMKVVNELSELRKQKEAAENILLEELKTLETKYQDLKDKSSKQ